MGITSVGKDFIVNRLTGDSTANTINGFGWGSTRVTIFDSADTNLSGPLRYESVYDADSTQYAYKVAFVGYLADSNIGDASESTIREVALFKDSATPTPMIARHFFADLTKDSSFTLTCTYGIELKRWEA